jgi:hypothetical protein
MSSPLGPVNSFMTVLKEHFRQHCRHKQRRLSLSCGNAPKVHPHQCWFEKGEKDISATAQKTFAALSKIVSDIDRAQAHTRMVEKSR